MPSGLELVAGRFTASRSRSSARRRSALSASRPSMSPSTWSMPRTGASRSGGTSLRERLVTEGLAQVIEADCTGVGPFYAEGEVTKEHGHLALAALDGDPTDDARWFFGVRDLPRWLGYRLEHRRVGERLAQSASDACATARERAGRFL